MEVDADSFDHIKRSTSNATLTNEALMSNMEECVRQLVNDCDLSISHIRSSNCLRDLFNQMVLSIAERGYIQSWGLYCMKARLDSLQQLAIDQLTIPTYMTALGVGSRNISSILSVFSPSNGSSRNDQSLEGQVRTLLKDIFLLFVRSENELIRHGSDHSLDTNRARLFLELILLKCSPLYPQSVVLKEYGPRALEALTCHILGVLVVSSSIRLEIQNAIKQVINALHEENAGTWEECSEDMAKIIVGYFQWIRSSSLQNIKDCRREEIIAAVNPSVRACLKDETYHSSAHLVQVYHLKYKTLLYNMPIPIQPYSIRDIKQAHKDILRENIRVNKVMYIGGKTQTPTGSLQSGKDLQLDGAYINKFDRKAVAEEWEEVDATEAIAEELKKVVVFLCGLPDGEMLQTSPSLLVRKSASRTLPGMQSISTSQKMRNWVQDMDLYDPPSSGSAAKPTVIIPPLPPASSLVQPSANTYRDFHRILLAYTLLAASRTYATGDAFMILNDLYGGEGLMFCPFHRWSASSSSGPSTPQRSRSMSTKSQTSESAMTDECDCQVAITTSGVKVKLREHYRLYATAEMNRCTNANQLPPPLACFECTTTTIILLNPSAVASSVGDTGREIQLDQLSFSQLFDLLISNPQRMVHRAVSIEPYI